MTLFAPVFPVAEMYTFQRGKKPTGAKQVKSAFNRAQHNALSKMLMPIEAEDRHSGNDNDCVFHRFSRLSKIHLGGTAAGGIAAGSRVGSRNQDITEDKR